MHRQCSAGVIENHRCIAFHVKSPFISHELVPHLGCFEDAEGSIVMGNLVAVD